MSQANVRSTAHQSGITANGRAGPAQSAMGIPVGRYGRPDEFSAVVAFLASERASFVNGAMIRIDGGMIESI